jgi:TPR repeat protein
LRLNDFAGRIGRGKFIASLLTGLMLTVSGGITIADQLEDGVTAYQHGDFATALRIFQPLAERGDATAQSNLGVLYEKGQGTARDYREALKWYRQGAQQGYADAQFNLGVMFYAGHGVTQDYREAAKWFRLAAEQGAALAQSNLGFMYEKGQGLSRDYVRAHMWYSLAASRLGGDDGKLATEYQGIIAKSLTPTQLSRAQNMARQCKASSFKNCD